MAKYLLAVTFVLATVFLMRSAYVSETLATDSEENTKVETPVEIPTPKERPKEVSVSSSVASNEATPPAESLKNGMTAEEKEAVLEAERKEIERQALREEYFSHQLKLDPTQIVTLNRMLEETRSKENELLWRPTRTAEESDAVAREMVQLRRNYESEMQKVMGPEKWQTYLQYYFQSFGVTRDNHASLRLPLK